MKLASTAGTLALLCATACPAMDGVQPGAVSGRTPAQAAAQPVAASTLAARNEAAASPARPTASQLDIKALEKRLTETSAIGVLTKLTLKNQVDDLLGQFRAHYDGRKKTAPGELRQPYDLLIMKVLALLQDGDPELARSIVESREAIWAILTDPEKFKKL